MQSRPAQDFSYNPDHFLPPATAHIQNVTEQEDPVNPLDTLQVHVRGHLVFAMGGACLCYLPDRCITVLPGSALWIPGGVKHRFFHSDLAASGYLFLDPARYTMSDTICSLVLPEYVQYGIRHLAESDPSQGFSQRNGRLFGVLLDEIQSAHRGLAIQAPLPRHPRLIELQAKLANNPGSPLKLEDWADMLHMSARTLERLVFKETGLSFIQWRNLIRLNAATVLLSGRAPISEIAYQLGYATPSAFGQMFKRHLLMSPQDFRDQLFKTL